MTERQRPQISVIIPCLNHGRFLKTSIGSVLASGYGSLEIIVIDDGSTEPETVRILDEAAWPKTRIIRQQNAGASAARNRAIRESNGEFFLTVDADDAIAPTLIEKAVAILEANPKLGLAYPEANVFGDIREHWAFPPYNFYDLLWRNQIGSCALIRRQAWEEAGGYDEKMLIGYEDWDFWIRLGKRGWYGQVIPEPLFYYRRHGRTRDIDAKRKHEDLVRHMHDSHRDIYGDESRLAALRREWPTAGSPNGRRSPFRPLLRAIWRSPLFPTRLRTALRPPPPLPDWLE